MIMRRAFCMVLTLCLLLGIVLVTPATTVSAAGNNLSCKFISNKANRAYVEMMLQHYIYDLDSRDTSSGYPVTLSTLRSGKPVVLMFEGASDLAGDDLKYRSAALCIVVKWSASKKAPFCRIIRWHTGLMVTGKAKATERRQF